MKALVAAMTCLLALAGCGADGTPFRPSATAGISIGSGGISTDCAIGTTNGTVSVRVGC